MHTHRHTRRRDGALSLTFEWSTKHCSYSTLPSLNNPCVGFNLENAVCHAGEHLADAVEQKKNKYRGSFPATYSLLPLAVSTCGWTGSDVQYAFIKEIDIRRIEHRSEIHSNKSQHLADGTEAARLRRRFSFLFYNRYLHSARVIVSAESEWRLRAPDSSRR